jgi:hypothetical protein
MYEPCILSYVSWQRIQYNTQRYAKPPNFSTDRTTPLRLHIQKEGITQLLTMVNTFQCKTNDLIVYTDTCTVQRPDLSPYRWHHTRHTYSHLQHPTPSLFGLGKDKKSRVVHELNEYHIASQIRIKMKGWALQSKAAWQHRKSSSSCEVSRFTHWQSWFQISAQRPTIAT